MPRNALSRTANVERTGRSSAHQRTSNVVRSPFRYNPKAFSHLIYSCPPPPAPLKVAKKFHNGYKFRNILESKNMCLIPPRNLNCRVIPGQADPVLPKVAKTQKDFRKRAEHPLQKT